jgi:hypothetical protein
MTHDLRIIRLPIMVSARKAAEIDDFRFKARIESRAEAMRRLIDLGLQAVKSGSRTEKPRSATP